MKAIGSWRWWGAWSILLALATILGAYFDMGAPGSRPRIFQLAIGVFNAPGGIVGMALFWRPFAGGDTSVAARISMALVNSVIWLLAIYAAVRIRARLAAGKS